MNLRRYQYDTDFLAGSFDNCRLDTLVNISPYAHPAVVPSLNVTASTPYSGDQLRAGTAGAAQVNILGYTAKQWSDLHPLALTWQPGDGIQFTTTAQQVAISLAGVATAGMGFQAGTGTHAAQLVAGAIRNGAQAQIFVDGALQTTVDTYQATPVVTLFLDGASHVVKVAHSGYYNPAINPIGPVTQVTGTSFSGLSVTALPQGGFKSGTWRVTCTTAGGSGTGKYKLEFAANGTGAFSTIDTNLTVGTAYAGTAAASGYAAAPHVPGCTLTVTGTLALNDQATFTTDSTMLAVTGVSLATGTGSATGTYTSAVIDSGDPATNWFLLEWRQGQPMGQISFSVGNTPAPDSTWQATTIAPDLAARANVPGAPGDTTLPTTGERIGMAGLASCPRGRYAQWKLTFPAVSTSQPYFRDAALYYWVPERDPVLAGNLALGFDWVPGPNLLAILGTKAVTLAATRQAALDYVNSYSLGGAVDRYLAGYGTDLGQPRYSGEPPEGYRSRLLGSLASRQAGGSIPFIAAQLNQLVNGVANPVTTTATGGIIQSTCGGVVVAQKGSGQQYQVTIPPYPYAGLAQVPPTQARAIITAHIAQVLTPVGSVINPSNAGTYNITFN